jgi:general stress protein 26
MDKVKNLKRKESVRKLHDMIKIIGVSMFFTTGKSKKDDVRPMAVADVDEDGNIWFLASKSSEKIKSIMFDDNVHLVFAHPGKEMYLDVDGNAEISDDENIIHRLWTPLAKAWFTSGSFDPDICAIKVKPIEGYYWDTRHGVLVEFLKILTAVVTGKKSGDGVSGQIAVN